MLLSDSLCNHTSVGKIVMDGRFLSSAVLLPITLRDGSHKYDHVRVEKYSWGIYFSESIVMFLIRQFQMRLTCMGAFSCMHTVYWWISCSGFICSFLSLTLMWFNADIWKIITKQNCTLSPRCPYCCLPSTDNIRECHPPKCVNSDFIVQASFCMSFSAVYLLPLILRLS